MGKALIIQGADFSANKLGTLDGTTVTVLGTSESLWSQADTTVAAGNWGYLCQTNGWITKVKVTTVSAASFKIYVYRDGEFIYSKEYELSNNTRQTNIVNVTPLEVKSGDIVGLRVLTSSGFVYKANGGDIDTYSSYTKSGSQRIYPWNFTIVNFG